MKSPDNRVAGVSVESQRGEATREQRGTEVQWWKAPLLSHQRIEGDRGPGLEGSPVKSPERNEKERSSVGEGSTVKKCQMTVRH